MLWAGSGVRVNEELLCPFNPGPLGGRSLREGEEDVLGGRFVDAWYVGHEPVANVGGNWKFAMRVAQSSSVGKSVDSSILVQRLLAFSEA